MTWIARNLSQTPVWTPIDTSMPNGSFIPSSISNRVTEGHLGKPDYAPAHLRDQVDIALAEGWHWLEINMLIMPQPGYNGSNGWKIFTRRGKALLDNEEEFRAFTHASKFPRELLHSALGDDVWLELAQGKHADAIFKSFRAVEEAMRSVGGFSGADVGVKLARKAFQPDKGPDKAADKGPAIGPLTDETQEAGEQQGLMDLFAGAMGTFKNPHSHRTVPIDDALEAQQAVAFASLLLRIIDERARRLLKA